MTQPHPRLEDLEAIRHRYAAERDKRIREDGNDQYVEIAGDFARYVDDPYVEPGYQRDPGVPLISRFHIRVVDVARKIPGDFDVLVVAVFADALVTLRGIAMPDGFKVFKTWVWLGHRVSERERKLSVAPSYTTRGEKPRKLSGIGAERFSREAGIKECCDRQHEEPQ